MIFPTGVPFVPLLHVFSVSSDVCTRQSLSFFLNIQQLSTDHPPTPLSCVMLIHPRGKMSCCQECKHVMIHVMNCELAPGEVLFKQNDAGISYTCLT